MIGPLTAKGPLCFLSVPGSGRVSHNFQPRVLEVYAATKLLRAHITMFLSMVKTDVCMSFQ
jgi:hypothetical protein